MAIENGLYEYTLAEHFSLNEPSHRRIRICIYGNHNNNYNASNGNRNVVWNWATASELRALKLQINDVCNKGFGFSAFGWSSSNYIYSYARISKIIGLWFTKSIFTSLDCNSLGRQRKGEREISSINWKMSFSATTIFMSFFPIICHSA